MTSFFVIPYNDIVSFLEAYNLSISNDEKQNYVNAWNFLTSNDVSEVPVSICDFIIALNLNNKPIESYKTLDILSGNEDYLGNLAKSLTLSSNDRERIIRILGYLGLLINDTNVYKDLPDEILRIIGSNLECSAIKLFCNISERFNRFCQRKAEDNNITNYQAMLLNILEQDIKINLNNLSLRRLEGLCLMKRKYLDAGPSNSFVIDKRGNTYGFGAYFSGIMSDNSNIPILTSKLKDTIQISSKRDFLLALDILGNVHSFGSFRYGKLGRMTVNERRNLQDAAAFGNSSGVVGIYEAIISDDETERILGLNNIIKISTGRQHSLVLNDRGQVFSFGSNHNGQLGLSSSKTAWNPTLILNISNIIDISAGEYHSLLLNNEGKVWSFGDNSNGQLGREGFRNGYILTLIPELNDIKQISAGTFHSLILNDRGHIYSFGSAIYGRVGLGKDSNDKLLGGNTPTRIPKIENITQVSAGLDHSLALNKDGYVYSFGSNNKGQLGLGDNIDRDIPTLIPDLSNIIEISAGTLYSLVLDKYGYIHSFGANTIGQLGLGDYDDRNIPIMIPDLNIFI